MKIKKIVDAKPCPFCGEAEDLFLSEGDYSQQTGRTWYSLICGEQCQTEGPWEPSEADAIAAWNTRAPIPESTP